MRSEDDIIERIEARSRGSFARNAFWLFFRMPGSLILWAQYYFPSKGRILVSARQRGNAIMEILFSVGFWIFVALMTAVVVSRHS